MTKRKCKVCAQRKPLDQFRHISSKRTSRTCVACEQSPPTYPQNPGIEFPDAVEKITGKPMRMLFIDEVNQTAAICLVHSAKERNYGDDISILQDLLETCESAGFHILKVTG